MPGILKQPEDQRTQTSISKASVHAAARNMAAKAFQTEGEYERVNGNKRVNGVARLTNGVVVNSIVADGAMASNDISQAASATGGRLPPEIEHITFGYQPLGKLILRLAQDTFNSLAEVINDMADMQPSQSHLPNGQSNGTVHRHSSDINTQKKTRLWNFAQDRRAQFIKILVLSQWSRQAEDVGKVIDLKVWLDNQNRLFESSTTWIGELKRILAPAKMPSPDLRTALEVLSTGKASWIPDLGYLPPEELSSQRLLKALRTINTLLTIRLNLHEEIPPPFQDFSISSGKATFHVREEFELDVSIADEDVSSQLYFIDFRFIFSPSLIEIPTGRLRDEIEGKVNDVLRKEGLPGCYGFLHDLVLTHKLSILRQQAFEMARGHWSENMKVEAVRRSIVVQYWLNRPGGKNWIEIGIKRAKRKDKSRARFPDNQGVSCIALRWHRQGKEVCDEQFSLNVLNISMEAILKQVIARHTSIILKETAASLRKGSTFSRGNLALGLKVSATEPTDCSLFIQITKGRAVTLIQEPISGAFALLPTSNLCGRVERDLNSLMNPESDAPARIASLRCAVAVEQIESRAKVFGWEPWKALNPNQETIKRLFPCEISRMALFGSKAWGPGWVVAYTATMMGDSFWIAEVSDAADAAGPTDTHSQPNKSLQAAYKIYVDGSDTRTMDPSYLLLSQVQNAAASMVSQHINTRYLAHLNIPHTLRTPKSLDPSIQIPDLYIFFSPKHTPSASDRPMESRALWSNESVKLIFQGLDASQTSVIHIVLIRLKTPIFHIESLTSNLDSSLAFHPHSGSISFRLLTPVGKPTIPLLLERLKRIGRLVRFLGVMERYQIQCESVSLSRLQFTYATSPQSLKAEINFSTDAPIRISFDRGNPHLRIQDFLTSRLGADTGLEEVVLLLRITLPLLRAFSKIETACKSSDVFIFARSAFWYHLHYDHQHVAFDIKLRRRRDELNWYVQYMTGSGGKSENEKVPPEIQSLCNSRGEGWIGLNTGIAARIEGIEELIQRLNEAVRKDGEQVNEDREMKDDQKDVVVLD